MYQERLIRANNSSYFREQVKTNEYWSKRAKLSESVAGLQLLLGLAIGSWIFAPSETMKDVSCAISCFLLFFCVANIGAQLSFHAFHRQQDEEYFKEILKGK